MNALTTNNPAFIGFDHLFRRMENAMQRSETYPPHNIIKEGENLYSLELALAGYSKGDVNVELDGGVLTVTGNKGEREGVEYIHRGIGGRGFTRSFTLAEHMVVSECSFIDGLLRVDLIVKVPEECKPKKIEIFSSRLGPN